MVLLLNEPEQDAVIRALISSDNNQLSAGSWIELAAVLTRSNRSALFPLLDATMAEFDIRIATTTQEQAQIGREAYRR